MENHVLNDSLHANANKVRENTKIVLLIIADLTIYISILYWSI